jgi:Mg2+ and Co2+ transporter CorA
MPTPVPKDWELPQALRDRIGEQAGRQRTMHHDGHLLVILHELPDPNEPDTRSAQIFWRAPQGAWRSTKQGDGVASLRGHVDSYVAALDTLESQVERASTAEDYFAVLHATASLRRATRHMHRALQIARDAVPGDRHLIAIRDRAGDAERAAELINTYAQDGLEFTVAKKSEEQARAAEASSLAAHRLNLLAALFLPITAVGSILGMNLQHDFETTAPPWPFLAVTIASFGLGFLVKAAIVKRTDG